VLVPGFVRRGGARAAVAFVVVLVGLAVPFAWTGPAVGPGLLDYAERWEHNAFLYAGTERCVAWLDGEGRAQAVLATLQALKKLGA